MSIVSIIVPVYNAGSYLAPLLDSILNQTLTDWECILIDDGSTDGSGSVLDAYGERDPRFLVRHKENSGVAVARGDGAALASGEYLCFFDSDDLIHSAFLEEMVHTAETTNAAVVCCRIVPFAESAPVEQAAGKITVWQGEDAIHHLLHDKAVDYSLCNRLYHREVMLPRYLANGYRYNEDLLANWLALRKADAMAFLDFGGYFYRQQSQSTSHRALNEAFITQQWQIAARIARNRNEDTIRSFYYEKLLYLYSMILRQDNYQDFSVLGSTLLQFIKKDYNQALKYRNLSAKMKLVATLSVFPPQYYRPICRAMLKDRR